MGEGATAASPSVSSYLLIYSNFCNFNAFPDLKKKKGVYTTPLLPSHQQVFKALSCWQLQCDKTVPSRAAPPLAQAGMKLRKT